MQFFLRWLKREGDGIYRRKWGLIFAARFTLPKQLLGAVNHAGLCLIQTSTLAAT